MSHHPPVVVAMGYDGRGRREWLDDPDRGRWEYRYNGFDELVRQTDAVGNVQALAYDGLGRLKQRLEYTPGLTAAADDDVLTGDTRWKFDAEGPGSEGHGLGRLVKVADRVSGYLRKHDYDSLGRPAGHSVKLGRDGTYRARQTYDGYGRPYQVFDGARRGLRWGDNVTALRYNGQGYAYQWEDGVQAHTAPRARYRTITAQDARGNVTGETLGGRGVLETGLEGGYLYVCIGAGVYRRRGYLCGRGRLRRGGAFGCPCADRRGAGGVAGGTYSV